MTFKFLSTSPTFGYYAPEPVEYLKSHGCEVELVPQQKKLSEQELIQIVAGRDAMVVGVEKLTEPVIKAAKKMKIISKHGVGFDNIDLKAASKAGIVVTSAPSANSDAVADLTIGLVVSLARHIPSADSAVKAGSWPRVVGVELYGKVWGIIGLGRIGKRVAKRALGFSMRILANDITRDEAFAKEFGVTYLPLDKVLAESDFISIHVPLDASTRRMIGARELGLMKNKAFLVNISRGDIVDEEALYQALKKKSIGGAALDVFSQEPLGTSPLLALDNVITTPHMGGYTYDALRETGMVCVRDIVDVLEGRHPKFAVNPEVLK